MLPTFLILGTQKGGTTSLYRYLLRHPDVVPALEKEVRFFDYKFHKGLAWYRGHFSLQRSTHSAGARRITGEASPNYLFDPRAPRRVAETLPDVRLIVLLRHPVDRAYSGYRMNRRTGVERLSFSEAIEAEEERLGGELEEIARDERFVPRNRHDFAYLARGVYADQLERWFHVLPRDRFLIVDSAKLFSDPASVVRRTSRFLGLRAWDLRDFNVHNAGEGGVAIEPIVRKRLVEFFAPHNERLYQILGRRFDWDR